MYCTAQKRVMDVRTSQIDLTQTRSSRTPYARANSGIKKPTRICLPSSLGSTQWIPTVLKPNFCLWWLLQFCTRSVYLRSIQSCTHSINSSFLVWGTFPRVPFFFIWQYFCPSRSRSYTDNYDNTCVFWLWVTRNGWRGVSASYRVNRCEEYGVF